MQTLVQHALEETLRLLEIPSPTGHTQAICDHLARRLSDMGFVPVRLRKGGVLCTLGGEGRPLALSAHVDTLGLMVRQIKDNGRLAFARVGGVSYQALETENVQVFTRDGRSYTGVVQLINASKHVNRELDAHKRDDTTLEILLDEEVSTRAQTEALGVAVGDFVSLEPRARVTPSGFIRSRFLDDKLSAGMLLAVADAAAQGRVRLGRKTTLAFTVYEEVGHGLSAGLPQDTQDLLAVDMGCVGEGLACREQQVSICAMDSSGPYDESMRNELIALARERGIDYAVDVYPSYASDASTAWRAGCDVRCALIGAGVYASHGYERSHVRGVQNTLGLMLALMGSECLE